MTEHTVIATTPRERFMEVVNDELEKFEQQDAAFRRSERQERAAQLHIPVDDGNEPDGSESPSRSAGD